MTPPTVYRPFSLRFGVALALLVIPAAACDRFKSESQQVDELVGGLKKRAQDLGGSVEPLAREEIQKLFRIEYHVFELDPSLPSSALHQKLTSLGNDRWDCFNVQNVGSVTRVICKRLPISYLKLLPFLF